MTCMQQREVRRRWNRKAVVLLAVVLWRERSGCGKSREWWSCDVEGFTEQQFLQNLTMSRATSQYLCWCYTTTLLWHGGKLFASESVWQSIGWGSLLQQQWGYSKAFVVSSDHSDTVWWVICVVFLSFKTNALNIVINFECVGGPVCLIFVVLVMQWTQTWMRWGKFQFLCLVPRVPWVLWIFCHKGPSDSSSPDSLFFPSWQSPLSPL